MHFVFGKVELLCFNFHTMFMHIVFLGEVVFVLTHHITCMCIGFMCVMFLVLTLRIICTRASNARLSTRPLAFIMFTLSSHICVGNIATHLRIICTFGFLNTSHLVIVFGNFNLWASHSFQFWSFDDSLLHILEFTLQGEFSLFTFEFVC